MVSQWQRRRSEFNHDWLKNRYLTAISKWMNVLDGHIEDPVFETIFLRQILPQWEDRVGNVRELIGTFEFEMSPARLLDQEPLCALSGEHKQWLADALHRLWMARRPVRQRVEEAFAAIEGADSAYRVLVQRIETRTQAAGLIPTRDAFAAFGARCRILARCIEVFPSTVEVV
jgi:hypothetical protein